MKANSISTQDAYGFLGCGQLPGGWHVEGVLDYSAKSGRSLPPFFPKGLSVDVLDVSGSKIEAIPPGLTCYDLIAAETKIVELPPDIKVESRIDLTGCEGLERLPEGLTAGTLILRNCHNLKRLPEGLDVWFLDLTGCWAFDGWPESANIRGGRLQLRGCMALKSLPPYLKRLSALNLRDCPNLASLPPDLVVTGWLDLGHSGLADESSLPPGVEGTQLRWAGVNVDRRIAFHPETIEVGEVLAEKNAERRRVLLDRYGYGRFLQDANAQILDRDTDPGGPRQLLRVELDGDEDLVAMSCFCPSTQRQYIIRVPPATPTCRHAAAWIAGFDDPDDYRPLMET